MTRLRHLTRGLQLAGWHVKYYPRHKRTEALAAWEMKGGILIGNKDGYQLHLDEPEDYFASLAETDPSAVEYVCDGYDGVTPLPKVVAEAI